MPLASSPIPRPPASDYLPRSAVRGPRAGGRRCDGRWREDRPERPLVSVVTPVFNGVRYLAEALASVRAQTYDNVEHIVVDGGSTDGTLELLRQHEDSLDYWFSEPDRGMYDAYNKAIACAQGRYIKNLNHDDLLTPTSVEAATRSFARHGEGVCVHSELELIDAAGRFVERMGFDRAVRYWVPFLHPSWYVPRAVYRRLGPYCIHYRVAGDQEYFLRLQQAGVPFVRSAEVLARFRLGGASASYAGVRESFEILSHYNGLPQALYVASVMAWKKTRGNALRRLLGERAHHLAAWLKRRR